VKVFSSMAIEVEAMKWFLRLYVLFTAFHLRLEAEELSHIYLTGFTWYNFTDWRLTGRDYGWFPPQSFDPEQVQLGDTIFLDWSCVEKFVNDYLPKIDTKVILITSNYGYGADDPMPGRFDFLLEDDRIGAWFLQNIDRPCTDKLIPIPIGMANSNWDHGNLALMERMIAHSLEKREKHQFFYINITYRPERQDCVRAFQAKGFTFYPRRSFEHYLKDMADSIFVASPRGHGLDTHRTWEALLMGCCPVVPSSTLNPLYEDLPVVVIDNWDEVTIEYLHEWQRKLTSREWSREKLYAPYWFAKVRAIQERIRLEFF
jgi:hypothetical protein